MWQFDESAAQFPPPRSEEPAELRRAIVEELADHLSCALRREQLAGGQQEIHSARQRVLARFGDPAAIARRLWWDALWEKIMLQRIVTTACVVLAAVSCLALLLTWQSLTSWQTNSERQAREQRELFEKLLEQSDKQAQANADSLRELQALAAGHMGPVEWNPVELRFVAGAVDGPPVEGMSVYMTMTGDEVKIPPLRGVSDIQGIVRFKQVHYGTYSLQVGSPTKERMEEQFVLQPGESPTHTVVCPSRPEPTILAVRVVWPEELNERGLWLAFHEQAVVRPLNDRFWKSNSHLFSNDTPSSYVLVEPNGLAHSIGQRDFTVQSGGSYWRTADNRTRGRSSPSTAVLAQPLTESPTTILWPDPTYIIYQKVSVLLPALDEHLEKRMRGIMGERGSKAFLAMQLTLADWDYRIEQGVDGAPGTLWLTPTPEAIELVKQGLAEFDALMAGDAEEQGDAGAEAAADAPTAAE